MAKRRHLNIAKFIRFIVCCLVLIAAAVVLIFPVLIKMEGEKQVTVALGEEYVDAGVTSRFGKLTTEGEVDTNTLGTYKIVYKVLTEKKTRTVIVTDQTRPVVTLLGKDEIYLLAGSQYEDKGATATDNVDGDLTDKIKVESNLDLNTPGEYEIKYIATDSSGNQARERRKVIIVASYDELKCPAFDEDILHFDLNPYFEDVICKETEVSEDKFSELLLFGDSFIEKLGEIGIVRYKQLWSRPSTSTDDFYDKEIYTYGAFNGYNFFTAMDTYQPKNVLVLLNSDWVSRWTPEYLAASCDKAYERMKKDYPNTTFIICSIMPVEDYYDQNYIDMGRADFLRNDRINKMNVYICELCRKYGFKFMNAAESVKNPATGACYTEYIYEPDGVHLSNAGCKKMLEYIKSHLDW